MQEYDDTRVVQDQNVADIWQVHIGYFRRRSNCSSLQSLLKWHFEGLVFQERHDT